MLLAVNSNFLVFSVSSDDMMGQSFASLVPTVAAAESAIGAPKCEKTVEALLCRNLNVKSATLPNATSSRRIRLQDDLVTDELYQAFEEQFTKLTHARYDYEISVPLRIVKWKEFHVPKWEEFLNGLGLVGKVMCLVPGGDPVTCIGAFISVDDNGFIQIIETGSLE
ncbi:unnamed protein product [Lactuca virosa]|uniref:ATP synthase protein MI25 n=1 Tax=Lactuca virosa TaxID=75947 RepID=A0AAU9PUN4_9ASTR|nr:unnamed protein product [Lactuca virosa]